MAAQRKRQKNSTFIGKCLKKSLNVFLKETGMHGLKFVGDSALNIWERSFFLIAFVAAFVMTFQLTSNIYAKWISTPVIIGISPHATSIQTVPFPAITVCNMNQMQRSKVQQYKEGSNEKKLMKLFCSSDSPEMHDFNDSDSTSGPSSLSNSNFQIFEFVKKHSQPCEKMLRYCRFNAIEYDCGHLFENIITDEGLCCVFNLLPLEFLLMQNYNITRKYTTSLGYEPVAWDPEDGYAKKLPKKYYPHMAAGTGISAGLTVVLDAQLNEYYCSSTNGPGFKILLHNPITIPNVKEQGLVLGIGYETNFRLTVSRSEAMPATRSISPNDRQCFFKDEKRLLFHKIYTHGYCEVECVASFLYKSCDCIPHNFPRIFNNASVCSLGDVDCIRRARRPEKRIETAECRKECLPSCFDLSYMADALYFPLAKRDFRITNKHVENINKTYMVENIAIMNFYYRESAYYGSMKNVYIGFTEFLSNIGGVMGLFLGFSVISIAEMLYFLILKPLSEFITWKRGRNLNPNKRNSFEVEQVQRLKPNKSIWHTKELYPKGVQTKTLYFNNPTARKSLNKSEKFNRAFE